MRYIALLRGVNVGGKTIVKMERFRDLLAANGFANVKTYIQSGNAIFDHDSNDANEIEMLVEAIIEREFFKTPVIARTFTEFRSILDENPFKNERFEEKLFHIAFLKTAPDNAQSELMESKSNAGETYAVRGREVYCFLREGVADSVLGKKFIDNKLKIPSTARNMRTIGKIIELAEK
jgi:uncharacterized protein (DUF1697 family)